MTNYTPTPTTGPISFANLDAAFGLGYGLSAYRSQTWYNPNVLTTGTFSSGQISLSDFYNKQGNDPASVGTKQDFTGTSSYTIPLYRNSFVVEVWGGGGGGGGYGDSPGSSYGSGNYFGGTGGQSKFIGPNTLTANGGSGGMTAGTYTGGGTANGTGGAGGTASGGTTNTSGSAGYNGFAGAYGGPAYGGSYVGANAAGSVPGGGGGGSPGNGTGGKFPGVAGGGGGGGYSTRSYAPGGLAAGTVVTVTVGTGGAGYITGGGAGAAGRVKITWT